MPYRSGEDNAASCSSGSEGDPGRERPEDPIDPGTLSFGLDAPRFDKAEELTYNF